MRGCFLRGEDGARRARADADGVRRAARECTRWMGGRGIGPYGTHEPEAAASRLRLPMRTSAPVCGASMIASPPAYIATWPGPSIFGSKKTRSPGCSSSGCSFGKSANCEAA